MRKRLYEIIEAATEDDRLSNIYDIFMMVVIVAGLVPLAFKGEPTAFLVMDKVVLVIFIIDYILRLITADFKLNRGALSFVIYPFTPMAIIDLLCILPSVSLIGNAFRALKVFRLLRTFRVFRIFKSVRYSKSIKLIQAVLEKQRKPLISVAVLAVGYIMISALIIFNVEPDSFKNYFEAIYWATVSLTTMGYGDISPVTTVGRLVTIVSSLFGIAIIALPSGIISAGFMNELLKQSDDEKDDN